MNADLPETRSAPARIVIGLLTAAMMIAVILWSVWDSWRFTVRESRQATAQIATSLALQADEMIDRAAALALALRRHVAADRALLEPGNQQLADLIAKLLSAAPAWVGISVADAEGRLVGASTHADLRGGKVSIAQQPSFRMHAARRGGAEDGIAISPPFRLLTRPVFAFVVSVALRDESGGLVAVALVSVPAREVLRSLDPVREESATQIALAHRDGFVLAAAPDLPDMPPLRPARGWLAAMTERAGTTETDSPFSAGHAIVSHEQLARFPIVAVATQDLAELAGTWARTHSWRLAAGVLLSLAAIGLNLGLLRAVNGRLRAEAALRESSEGRFKDFAAIATDWFWETDAQHRFSYASSGPGAEGAPPEAFLGRTRSERARLIQNPVSPLVLELEAMMERREIIKGFVVDSVRPDGVRTWWEIRGRPLVDDAGRFRGYRGVARDVTDLREAQERIAASEARLTDSINSMPIGYALWDPRDRLVAWNRSYVEIWPTAGAVLRPGITFDAFIDMAMRIAWPAIPEQELRERVAERVARHVACGERWSREFPDGRVIEFSETRTSEGGILSLYADVTERERARHALAASEARFRDGIESMSQGFVLWSADETLVSWNSRAEALLPHARHLFVAGIDRSAFLSEAARALFPDLPETQLREIVARRVESQRRGESFEIRSAGRIIVATSHRTSDGGVVVTYNDVTEQHAAAATIRESEARFRDGIESMAQGFMLWDSRRRLVAWNARVRELLPHAADSLIVGIDLSTLRRETAKTLLPDYSETEIAALVRRRNEADERNEPFEIVNANGRIIIATPHRTSDGGLVVTYNDVSEERAAEAALRESEMRFRDGIEKMADGFTLWDPEDRLVAWNKRFERIAPIEAEVLRVGIRFAECLAHLESRLTEHEPGWEWRAYLARRRARRDTLGRPIEVTNIHGTSIEIIEQATSNGGVVSIYRDVTEARRAARHLAESEARFHDFADAASDWFWETDPDGRFTFVSGGVRRVGVDPDDLVGRTRAEYDAFRGRAPLPTRSELEEMIARREVIRGFCFVEPDPAGGEPRKIEIHGKPIHDATGEFRGYRGTGRDVTERDRQQAALARALEAEREMNAQQRRFVSIASHEFRTPLAVIDGATQRLAARLRSGDPEVDKRLDRIRGAVSRMTELIDRTLSSARLDDGRIEMELRALDVAGLLREVIERQGQISPEHRISLRHEAGDATVEGDPKLLEQVFANLVSNAVKYSGRSRRIEVTLAVDGAALRVAVRDHGIGIPPAEVPHLFTRFFRASTAMGIPGTGIGLHLVSELVRMHGGRIDVESEVGVGSTFTVTLPIRTAIVEADAAQ